MTFMIIKKKIQTNFNSNTLRVRRGRSQCRKGWGCSPDGSPWLLLCLDLLDDALHPGHQVPHHGEEAEFLRCVHQLRSPSIRGVQQALPRLQHLALHEVDALRSVASVLGVEAGRHLLKLLHLWWKLLL